MSDDKKIGVTGFTTSEHLAKTQMRFNVEEAIRSIDELTAAKNAAYRERNQLVALIAALARSTLPGWHAWLGKHEEDPCAGTPLAWDPEWMNIVFIETPAGQLSWHIHDSELHFFTGLQPALYKKWDGHTTEEKYERVMYLVGLMLGRS